MQMSAQVSLGWNNTELTAGARRAEGIVKTAAANMQGALKGVGGISLGNLAGIGIAGVGFTQLASGIAAATLTADDNRQSMLALEGSIEGARARLKELATVARSPGLGFDQVAAADVKLRSVGLTASESSRTILEVGNALALVGKGKADLDGVLLAFTQIISKGKVSAEEINQIAERVPQIRKILSQTFGTADTEAIQKLGISAEEFVRKTLDGFSQLPRAVNGLRGAWENLTDTVNQSAVALTDASTPEVIDFLADLENVLVTNRGAFAEAGQGALNFGRVLGTTASGAKQALDFVGEGWQMLLNDTFKWSGLTDGTTRSFDAQTAAARRLADEQRIVQVTAAGLARHQRELEIATQRVADAHRHAAEDADRYNKALVAAAQATAQRQITLQQQLAEESAKTRDLYIDDAARMADAKKKLLEIDRQLNAVVGQKGGEEIALKLNIEREKVMQRIIQLNQKLADDQARANADQARANADKARAAAAPPANAAPAAAEGRIRSGRDGSTLARMANTAGSWESAAADRDAARAQATATRDAAWKRNNRTGPSAFAQLQMGDSAFDRLQKAPPIFGLPAAKNPPAQNAGDPAQRAILERMLQFWQEALN